MVFELTNPKVFIATAFGGPPTIVERIFTRSPDASPQMRALVKAFGQETTVALANDLHEYLRTKFSNIEAWRRDDDQWRVLLAVESALLDRATALPELWRLQTAFRLSASKSAYPLAFAPLLREDGYEPILDHFAHTDAEGEMVIFYPDAEKARAGRSVSMKPGRYLTKYYPDLSAEKIRELAGTMAPIELKFARTADEIQAVYLNGPSSCMSKSAFRMDTAGVHPVRAYAAGDLAVAYLQREGRITDRALCWPARKLYGRIYGGADGKMERALGAAGYTQGSMEGARLALIHHPTYANAFILPFIDEAYIDVAPDGRGFVLSATKTYRTFHPGQHGVYRNQYLKMVDGALVLAVEHYRRAKCVVTLREAADCVIVYYAADWPMPTTRALARAARRNWDTTARTNISEAVLLKELAPKNFSRWVCRGSGQYAWVPKSWQAKPGFSEYFDPAPTPAPVVPKVAVDDGEAEELAAA